jgi:hypothetical protein
MNRENMRKVAIAVIFIGLLSLVVGGVCKLMGSGIGLLSPRSFAAFTAICFLLSINLLLLIKES